MTKSENYNNLEKIDCIIDTKLSHLKISNKMANNVSNACSKTKKHKFHFSSNVAFITVILILSIGTSLTASLLSKNNKISGTEGIASHVSEPYSTEGAIPYSTPVPSEYSPDTTGWKPTDKTVNNFDGVTMNVKKETISGNGLTIKIQNKSNKLCEYGEKFWLEKKINGKWYQVPVIKDNYAFTDIGYDVVSGHESEWNVDWNWLLGSLDSGEYRIIKDVLDFRNTGDYSAYFLSAEFIITNFCTPYTLD